MVANVKQIVTFDLVRNAAVAGDAITLVLDRQVDVSRGDMIVSIDAQPLTGHHFDAQIVWHFRLAASSQASATG